MTGKTKKAFLRITTAVAGVLGLVLLMWTPKTGKGILAYVALFAVLALTLFLAARKRLKQTP